ncbi:MAG: hypothetical protein ACD_76C00155G0002 [uncultured bacterium]|nr:MAG: hypothetical protein ACD_76C00155G0002 [uncultured bacterium]
MTDVKRKKGESFEAMLRRFTKRAQQSGLILEAKKVRYHSKKTTKTSAKERALRAKEVSAKRDWLIKTGQLVEDKYSFGKKR